MWESVAYIPMPRKEGIGGVKGVTLELRPLGSALILPLDIPVLTYRRNKKTPLSYFFR